MKKTFTLISAAVVALAANAQQENVWSTQEGLEALGLSSDAAELAGGTVLAEGAIGSFESAFTDNAKIMDISADGVKSVIVDGVEYKLTKGTTGSANPGGVSITTPPSSGWVYKIKAEADGYLTIFSKLSSNKAYYVFDGDEVTGMLQTYTLYQYVDLGEGQKVYSYTLPGDDELGWFDMDLPDADKYSDGSSLRWPEKIILGADAADVKKNGFGCIVFPIYAEGGTYLFCAQGSKANTNGFIYTPNEPTQIIGVVPDKTNADTGEVTPGQQIVFVGEPAADGISSVVADKVANDQMFNVLGQPVSDSYKGLVIKNGKKFYNR